MTHANLAQVSEVQELRRHAAVGEVGVEGRFHTASYVLVDSLASIRNQHRSWLLSGVDRNGIRFPLKDRYC
jgi:hypothetical protein